MIHWQLSSSFESVIMRRRLSLPGWAVRLSAWPGRRDAAVGVMVTGESVTGNRDSRERARLVTG